MNKGSFSSEEALLLIKKSYKPGLVLPILMSLIGMTLYWGLWMDLVDANYSRIGMFAVLSGVLMFLVGALWTSYYFRMLQYKREINDYKKNPDAYEW